MIMARSDSKSRGGGVPASSIGAFSPSMQQRYSK
jgi:hypothetical protein